jgi:hypothetical protein
VHETEEVDETILLEVDEEYEHESFEHIDDLSAPALFDEQDHKGTFNVAEETWDDSPMDAITTDAMIHQGIVDEPIFNL